MSDKGRIDILDGWRAISIALVVVGHLMSESALAADFSPELRSIAANYAQTGVQFFFGISGFVICAGLLREVERTGRVSVRGFYVRRAFRILPPLILYVLVAVVAGQIGPLELSGMDALRAVTFTCNLGPGCGWNVGHTWSLAYEEQFYLVFPILFIAMGRFRRPALLGVAALMAAGILLLYWTRSMGIAPMRNFFSIACGVVAALYQRPILAALARAPAVIILACAALPFAPPLMQWNSRITWFIYLVAVGPAVMLAMLGTVARQTSFLASAPLPQIGRASYGIYLWQQLATGFYPDAGPSFYIVSITLMSVLVAAQYISLERPMIALGRDLATSPKPLPST